MPAPARLRRSEDFQRTVKSGARAGCSTLVLYALSQPDSEPTPQSRVGLIVNKQVGNAVVRNRVKRRLRAAAQQQLLQQPGIDYVVRARPAAAKAEFSELTTELASAARRVTTKLVTR